MDRFVRLRYFKNRYTDKSRKKTFLGYLKMKLMKISNSINKLLRLKYWESFIRVMSGMTKLEIISINTTYWINSWTRWISEGYNGRLILK